MISVARSQSRAARDAFRRSRVYAAATKRVGKALDEELRQTRRIAVEAGVLERRARQRLMVAIRKKAICEMKRVHYPLLCLRSSRPERPALAAASFALCAKERTMFSEFVRANYTPGTTLDELSCRWKMLSVSEKSKFHPLRKQSSAPEAVLALVAKPSKEDASSPVEQGLSWEAQAYLSYLNVGFNELQSCLGATLTREQWMEIAPYNWVAKTEVEKKHYA
jgi:hypothetical protein